MALAKNEVRFSSDTSGGVALGPFALAIQGDVPKRRFNSMITNFGRDSGDEDIQVKAQEADAVGGPWSDADAGTVTVKLRATENYEFYVKGTSEYWRLYSTGKSQAMIQFFDNEIDNILVVP